MSLDLPLIWVALIAVAVMLYVLLDGFDLAWASSSPWPAPTPTATP